LLILISDYFFKTPFSKDSTKSTKNIKKIILAIPADAPAIPPKPKIAAIIAITIKIIVHRNILFVFCRLVEFVYQTHYKFKLSLQCVLTQRGDLLIHLKKLILMPIKKALHI